MPTEQLPQQEGNVPEHPRASAPLPEIQGSEVSRNSNISQKEKIPNMLPTSVSHTKEFWSLLSTVSGEDG